MSEATPLLGQSNDEVETKHHPSQLSSSATVSTNLNVSGQQAVPPFSWSQKKLLAVLVLVSSYSGALDALMFPFFPGEASRRGLSQTLISGVFSCFAAAQLASYPLLGRLAPSVGVRRLYSVGLATAGLTTVTFGALQHIPDATGFISACFAVRVVEALGAAAITTCAYTMVSSSMPERASTAAGFLAAALSVGLAVSPAVGGGLFALGGFGLPFYVLGALMLVTAAATTWLLPAVDDAPASESDFLRRLATLAGSSEAWVCSCVVVIYFGAFTTFGSCLAPYALSAIDVAPAELGLFYLVASSTHALTSVVWGRLLEPVRNPYYVMSVCLLVAACALLLMPPWPPLGLQPSRWLLGGAMTMHETVLGGAFTPCLKMMTLAARRRRLPDGVATRALVSSVFGAAFALGLVLGPVSGGALVDRAGFPEMMAVLAAVQASVALLVLGQALLVTWRDRSTAKHAAEGWEAGRSAHDVKETVP